MEYLIVTPSQFRDIRSVCQERELEIYFSQESDGIHVYGSESELAEIESIIWAAQVVDGLGSLCHIGADIDEYAVNSCQRSGDIG